MADRRNKTTRDMALTMGVVVVVIAIFAIFEGGFTFAPGGATAGPAPTADVVGNFGQAQRSVTFPITVPRGIPADWHPNSFTITDPQADSLGKVSTVRGGWLTADGAFVMLAESSGSVPQVLDQEVGAAGRVNGTVTVGGSQWSVTAGVRDEAAWVRTDGQTTYLITGNADQADFRTVAAAVSD